MAKILFNCVLSVIILGNSSAVFAQDSNKTHTYIDVRTKMDKIAYKLGEPLGGKIVITNAAPANLPSVFMVKLYKGKKLRFSTTVSIDTIFTGTMDFEFKNFGIPRLRDDASSIGEWRLVIHQVNQPEEKARAEFRIE